MSNVIQFPSSRPRPASAPTAVEEKRNPASAVRLVSTAASAAPVEEVSPLQQVMEALAFYARQGYDGGLKARRAMVAMIAAEQTEPDPDLLA